MKQKSMRTKSEAEIAKIVQDILREQRKPYPVKDRLDRQAGSQRPGSNHHFRDHSQVRPGLRL